MYMCAAACCAICVDLDDGLVTSAGIFVFVCLCARLRVVHLFRNIYKYK